MEIDSVVDIFVSSFKEDNLTLPIANKIYHILKKAGFNIVYEITSPPGLSEESEMNFVPDDRLIRIRAIGYPSADNKFYCVDCKKELFGKANWIDGRCARCQTLLNNRN